MKPARPIDLIVCAHESAEHIKFSAQHEWNCCVAIGQSARCRLRSAVRMPIPSPDDNSLHCGPAVRATFGLGVL